MQGILRGGNRVLISRSINVHTNLALERYLAENIKHQSKTRLLLLWRNKPCVVIGRYQNPYVECDVKYLAEKQIDFARRYSGGGKYVFFILHFSNNLFIIFDRYMLS
jgi:lipoate-protein ligase A